MPDTIPLASGLFIEMLQTDPVLYLAIVIGVMLSIVLHELGHALTALHQGDETPRLAGRLTLNPLVHMGHVSLIVLALVGIAWGQTPVNPANFRSRYGAALVAFAGPLVNAFIALVALTVLGVWISTAGGAVSGAGHIGQTFLLMLGYLNIALAIFNLLPLPPLDGAAVVGSLVPAFHRFAAKPANAPFFTGGFLLVFFTAGQVLFPLADRVALTYLRLFQPAIPGA